MKGDAVAYQLDHMQTICILLQTDNHINTSSLNFYTPDALPDAHDAEEQPEDEADEQHVEDGRDRLDQRVHHHLPQPQSMRVISCNLPKIVIQQLSQVIWQTCIVVPLPKGHLDPPIWAQTSLSPKPAHDLLAALHNTSYAQHTDDAIFATSVARGHI